MKISQKNPRAYVQNANKRKSKAIIQNGKCYHKSNRKNHKHIEQTLEQSKDESILLKKYGIKPLIIRLNKIDNLNTSRNKNDCTDTSLSKYGKNESLIYPNFDVVFNTEMKESSTNNEATEITSYLKSDSTKHDDPLETDTGLK